MNLLVKLKARDLHSTPVTQLNTSQSHNLTMFAKLPSYVLVGSLVLSGASPVFGQLLLSMFSEASCPSDQPHITDFIQPFSGSANCFAMPGGASVVTNAPGCSTANFFSDTTCSTQFLSLSLPAGGNQCFSFPFGSVSFTCGTTANVKALANASITVTRQQ
ncbi:hypothetical protein BDQ17DRAFT_1429444 [Cyathus striatus]|nr:hypothetical protein BDQ17DRAFT_1429444 [Cyathus striatus]